MGDNKFPTSNQALEQLMQSPRQAGNFAGRPPMRPPNGNNNLNPLGNNGMAQVRAYQQAQLAFMNQAGFVRPNPFQAHQLNMMNMVRGPNLFPQSMTGMLNNQNFQAPPGMMNMVMGQNPQPTSQPSHQTPTTTPQSVSQTGSRLPPTPSTPAPPLTNVDPPLSKSSHPPSRSVSILPAIPGSVSAPADFHEKLSEIDFQGDRIFRDCLDAFSGPEHELSDINYWIKLVNNFFSPKAYYRHQYLGSGPNSRSYEFRSDFCLLPYMLQSSFNSGSTKAKFILSKPRFQRKGSYLRISYDSSEIVSQKIQSWTLSETSISIVFEGDGKMLAWDFSTKRCQEYISRSSLEQYISIINSRLNSSGNNEAAIPFSEFISAFPPQITDGSVSRKLVDKLEILNSTSLLTPLIETQCTLKRPISACCDMYFRDFGQAPKGSLSSHSTPRLPTSRVTSKSRPPSSNTSAAQSLMSPLNPAKQLNNSSTLNLDSPGSQADSGQPSFSLTPLQTTSDLVDSGAPSKRAKSSVTAKGAPRKARTAGNSTRARKSSTSSLKASKTEDG